MRIKPFNEYIVEIFNPKKIQGREAEANKLKIMPTPERYVTLTGDSRFRDFNAAFAKIYGEDHPTAGDKNWKVAKGVKVFFHDTDNNGMENSFTLNNVIMSVDLMSEFSEPWDNKLNQVPNVKIYVDEGEMWIDQRDLDRLSEFVSKHIISNIHDGTSGMLDHEDDVIKKKYSDYMFDVIPLFKEKVKAKLKEVIKVSR